MLHLFAGQSPRSVRVEHPAHHTRGAAIARLLFALICAVIFFCALASPYFAVLLFG
jgi:hypothetical protein